MGRLFFKTFLTTFLWIILLANLLIAFDLVSVVGAGWGVFNGNVDWSDKYFGVSTLIHIFENLDQTRLGKFANTIGNFYNRYQAFLGNYFTSIDFPGVWKDVVSFIDVLKAIGETLINVGKILASMFVISFGIIIYFLYAILMILEIFYTFIFILFGSYYATMPTTMTHNSVMLITPLMTAV